MNNKKEYLVLNNLFHFLNYKINVSINNNNNNNNKNNNNNSNNGNNNIINNVLVIKPVLNNDNLSSEL